MSTMTGSIIAVDIGNARMKIGEFGAVAGVEFPEPRKTILLDAANPRFDRLESWLNDLADAQLLLPSPACGRGAGGEGVRSARWFISSVNRPGADGLIDWLQKNRSGDPIKLLSVADMPLRILVDRPDLVGIDRLVDAVAANRLRQSGRPAVIVDMGTAVTIDLVAADGAFMGGAITPGMEISARALSEFTDLLPLAKAAEFSAPPPALGTSTDSAIRSGLFWGATGAIRELIEQLSSVPLLRQKQCNEDQIPALGPQIFLTGGTAPAIAALLGPDARFVPHLTLAGIAITAGRF
jgi:type III pantothenate kinase